MTVLPVTGESASLPPTVAPSSAALVSAAELGVESKKAIW